MFARFTMYYECEFIIFIISLNIIGMMLVVRPAVVVTDSNNTCGLLNQYQLSHW